MKPSWSLSFAQWLCWDRVLLGVHEAVIMCGYVFYVAFRHTMKFADYQISSSPRIELKIESLCTNTFIQWYICIMMIWRPVVHVRNPLLGITTFS